MAVTRQKKAEVLQELVDKFSKSKSVFFADYRGLDVAEMSNLRRKLREGGSECKVAKKTLMRLAAKQVDLEAISSDLMEGPVAATFSFEDELSGLKVLFNFSKENEKLKLLGGIVDGKVVSPEEVLKLAKLPGREELLAKLMGSMSAPVSGFVGVLGNVIGGFVRVLNAYKDSLPAEAAPAPQVPATETLETETPAAAEAPAEEA